MSLMPADVVGMRQNYGGMRTALEQLKCVDTPIGCGRDLILTQINSWDGPSQQEYKQSALCKSCQDKYFIDPEEGPQCSCDHPCCEADTGVGVVTCGSQHCQVHGEY